MRNRYLPFHLIVRNVCFVLTVWAGLLLVLVDTHAAANNQVQQAEPLQRLFLYQIAMKFKSPGGN
ncbi:MAG TPA: hypothetical protein V6D07_11410 [Trichocoleus sp.]